MIWQLMRRDPAWRTMLISTAVFAAICLALPRENFRWLCVWVVGMPWVQSQPRERATEFQAALPIRARDLFLARIFSIFAATWVPLVAGALVRLARGASDALILAEIGAGISVVTLGAQSSRVREIAGSKWAPAISVGVVWAVGWAAWSREQFLPWTWVFTICGLLCAALFCNIWRQLPATFRVTPLEVRPATRHQETDGGAGFIWKPILRGLFPLRLLGFLPMIVIFSVGGQWGYLAMFCTFPMLGAMACLSWALTLPVRRGALVAVALLPWGMAVLLGILLGNRFGPVPSLRLVRSASQQVTEVKIPLEFWHVGKAPVIEAPWGETWQPETLSLRGVLVYNPYSFGPGNSARFFEWQFQRVTQVVYGEAIDFADFQRRGRAIRPLLFQARLLVLNLCACACLLMLLVNVSFTSMHWRFRRAFADLPFPPALLLVAPMVCVYMVDIFGGPPPDILTSLVNALLLRLSAVLPSALPLVALAGAIPVVLLGWTAARLLRGVELPKPAVPTR